MSSARVNKSHNIKGTLSVRNGQTLVLTIKKGAFDFISEYKEVQPFARSIRNPPFMVNKYNYRNMFSENIVKFLDDIYQAMNEGNWNSSRPEVDHVDIGWYVEVNVGTWKSPYQLILS